MPLTPILRSFEEEESDREEYIEEDILVDAYDDEEVFTSWYYYLQDALNFPFTAMVKIHQPGNTLMHSRKVQFVSMAAMARCGYWQMWGAGYLSTQEDVLLHFFLSDITEVEDDPERIQALEDWNYWRRNRHDEMWEE